MEKKREDVKIKAVVGKGISRFLLVSRGKTLDSALMPKKTGAQEIPSIRVGTEFSNPVRITVNEPTNAPPGEADVFGSGPFCGQPDLARRSFGD